MNLFNFFKKKNISQKTLDEASSMIEKKKVEEFKQQANNNNTLNNHHVRIIDSRLFYFLWSSLIAVIFLGGVFVSLVYNGYFNIEISNNSTTFNDYNFTSVNNNINDINTENIYNHTIINNINVECPTIP